VIGGSAIYAIDRDGNRHLSTVTLTLPCPSKLFNGVHRDLVLFGWHIESPTRVETVDVCSVTGETANMNHSDEIWGAGTFLTSHYDVVPEPPSQVNRKFRAVAAVLWPVTSEFWIGREVLVICQSGNVRAHIVKVGRNEVVAKRNRMFVFKLQRVDDTTKPVTRPGDSGGLVCVESSQGLLLIATIIAGSIPLDRVKYAWNRIRGKRQVYWSAAMLASWWAEDVDLPVVDIRTLAELF